MNEFDAWISVWFRLGWPLLLAFTVSVVMVAGFRKPCRAMFGADRTCLLWLLPPTVLLAVLLPHAEAPGSTVPPIILSIAILPDAIASAAATSGASDWRPWTAAFWLLGALIVSALAVRAQGRYRKRLRGAVQCGVAGRWPIMRAADSWVGPALVGAWHPCIVVPSDFDARYAEDERDLILAHEVMHARRSDGKWLLLGQCLAAIFWFHPLAWWALSTFRRDQEIACDAAVLRENGSKRRLYANAMLKTQPVPLPLPVGCAWSPRHPLTERIAMLKHTQPGGFRRTCGAAFAATVIALAAGTAYAAILPVASPKPGNTNALAAEYQLAMRVEIVDGEAAHRQAHRFSVTMCQAPGKAARVSSQALAVEAIVTPLQGGRVRIDTTIFDATGHTLAKPELIGGLGDPLRVVVGTTGDNPRYAVDITPLAGCPARKLALQKPA